MPADEDDLTPEQRGLAPPSEALSRRETRTATGRGRLWRGRSWLTVLVALLATAVCAYLLLRA